MPRPNYSYSLRKLTVCALFAALICVLSPIAVPIGAVPISLGLLGVLITAVTLPPTMSTVSILVFLALGLCGLPVYSGGMSGAMVLAGPTGGYLWSYLLIAPLTSLIAQIRTAKIPAFPRALIGCCIGTALCYLCGTAQFVLLTHTALPAALAACVLPFLPFDILKSILASALGIRLKKALKRTFSIISL